MANWTKKILFSSLIIMTALIIQYINDLYLHNLMLYVLNYAYLVGLLVLTIGILWNNESEKIFSRNQNQEIEQRIRQKIDAKIMMEQTDLNNYFKKQYINNEIDNL